MNTSTSTSTEGDLERGGGIRERTIDRLQQKQPSRKEEEEFEEEEEGMRSEKGIKADHLKANGAEVVE